MIFRYFFISYFYFSFIANYASASVEIRNLKTNQPVDSSLYSSKEGFIVLDSLNTVYGLEIILKKSFPYAGKAKVLQADLPEADASFLKLENGASNTLATVVIDTAVAEGEHKIVTGANQTFIQDSSGNNEYVIDWRSEQSGVIFNSCPDEIIKLEELKKLKSKSPIGVICRFDFVRPLLTISPVKEVRWISSTLNEVSGKGERFRTFEIPSSNLSGEVSGSFNFNLENQSFDYQVYVNKAGARATTMKIPLDKVFSLGMANMNLDFSDASYSSSSFYYQFDGLTDYIFNNFKLGFGFFSSFSTTDDPTSIKSMDTKITLGYYSQVKEDTKFSWGVWLGHRNFDFSQELTITKLQSSQFGIGLDTQYQFSPKNRLLVYFDMSSLGSKIVSSHLKWGLNFKHNFIIRKTELSAGALFESSAMSAMTSTGEDRKFGLTKIGGTLDF